jgi:hypothetical protein
VHTVAEIVEAVVACGVTLRDGVSVDDVVRACDRRIQSASWDQATERGRWLKVLAVFGTATEPLLSDDVLLIDMECDADYPRALVHLNRLAGEPIVRVVDWTGMQYDDAVPLAVTVRFGATDGVWEFANHGDWLDAAIFRRFDEVLASRSRRRLYRVDEDSGAFDVWDALGQGALTLCTTASTRDAIEAAGPVRFNPASGPS